MIEDERKKSARKEIQDTLRICNFCFGCIGVSLIDDSSKNLRGRLRPYFAMFITFTLLFLLMLGQYSYVFYRVGSLGAIEGLIGSNLHTAGYGLMRSHCDDTTVIVKTIGQGKLLTIWYKQDKFRQLVRELADIWPVDVRDDEVAAIKRESLSALRRSLILYTFWNAFGVWVFNLTPITEFLYHKTQGIPSELGYVYQLLYPFDKTKPYFHGLAYIFEVCSGVLSVSMMLGTDLLFMTMTSHMCMLLRVLQLKIRNLIDEDDIKRNTGTLDCYKKILGVVKIHQRLIQYINDLEGAFAAANLINVLLSSINICSCTFNVVFLDPWVRMSNKFFLGAALTQMGIVCWYADDIYRASLGVSDAVFESGWFRIDVRSRRALLVMLQRSQKPLYFTALKFSAITMATYSSILTSSYSYFTLLYSSFKQHGSNS